MNRFEEIDPSYLQNELSLYMSDEHADLLLSIGVYDELLFVL